MKKLVLDTSNLGSIIKDYYYFIILLFYFLFLFIYLFFRWVQEGAHLVDRETSNATGVSTLTEGGWG